MNKDNKKYRPIFHCYGHGGSGITLAMGCAQDLVQNHILPYIAKNLSSYLVHGAKVSKL
jgi:hypothetical protein